MDNQQEQVLDSSREQKHNSFKLVVLTSHQFPYYLNAK